MTSNQQSTQDSNKNLLQELIATSVKNYREGSIVKGRVIERRPKDFIIDIGYKSEGTIPICEFDNPEDIKEGDEIEVLLERLENDFGTVVLSKQKASQRQNWEKIVKLFQTEGIIKGRVKAVVKGGLTVNIGVEAFLPASQVDVTPPKDLSEFVGNTYDFKIVKINEDRKNIVLSRRELIESERGEKRQQFLSTISVGDKAFGIVKNITDFGAFIDLEGIDGLLHITDISWTRINHPNEVLEAGQRIEVIVLEINKDKERVSLGLKQLQNNPWDNIEERFPIGKKVEGKVTNLMPYGAFIEIDTGIEGLVHVSELSWRKRIVRPSDVLNLNQVVSAVILGVNKVDQKISLGVRQLEQNPWNEIEQRYVIGTKVHGKVRNMTAYGAFIELEEGIDGMVHVSDMSWTKNINHPSEVFKKGDATDAVVLDIDKENHRISLGIKQLTDDPWKDIDNSFKIGDIVTGKVSKITNFGAFIELNVNIDGLVHISQIREDRVERVKDVLKIGQEVEARVIKIDKVERRLGLSIKATNYTEEAIRRESEALEIIRSGDDMVSFGAALSAAEEEYRPSQNKKNTLMKDNNKPTIVAYLKQTCGWSKGVRAILEKYSLPYTEKDIIKNPEFRREMEEKSHQKLSPTLEINSVIIADVSGEELEKYLIENNLVTYDPTPASAPINSSCETHRHRFDKE